MTKRVKLKKCPFCGASACAIPNKKEGVGWGIGYFVRCVYPISCGMFGPHRMKRKQAIESWNKRVKP